MKKKACIISIIVALVALIIMFALYKSFVNSVLNPEKKTTGIENISVTGANGKTYNSYQEACEDGDFTAAMNYLNKIKQTKANLDDRDYSGRRELEAMYNEGSDYVFQQQANILLVNNDEQSAKRLILLLNEENVDPESKTKRLNKVISSAISVDNKYVLDLLEDNASLDNERLISFMIEKNEKTSSDKILGLLSDEFGECLKPNSGLQNFYYIDEDEHDIYEDGRSRRYRYMMFNSTLNKILQKSISFHNKYLAEKVLVRYTPTVLIVKGEYGHKYKGIEVDGNHCYIEFDNSEKEAAQKLHQQAIKDGEL